MPSANQQHPRHRADAGTNRLRPYRQALACTRRLPRDPGIRIGYLPRHGALAVATDGSARTTPDAPTYGPAGWAFYAGDDTYGYGTLPCASSGYAELAAVVAALTAIPVDVSVEILTDYTAVTGLLSDQNGRPRLVSINLTGAPKRGVKAEIRPLLCQLQTLLTGRPAPVTATHVKAHHVGQPDAHPCNAAADQLARHASRLARDTPAGVLEAAGAPAAFAAAAAH